MGMWYILRAQRGSHIPTLRPKYVLYSYMDPLGTSRNVGVRSMRGRGGGGILFADQELGKRLISNSCSGLLYSRIFMDFLRPGHILLLPLSIGSLKGELMELAWGEGMLLMANLGPRCHLALNGFTAPHSVPELSEAEVTPKSIESVNSALNRLEVHRN